VQRRDFITGLIGAAAALVPGPTPAQTRVPLLGYLWIGLEETDGPTLGGLRAGLVVPQSLLARRRRGDRMRPASCFTARDGGATP
jgi:hypothetical protein